MGKSHNEGEQDYWNDKDSKTKILDTLLGEKKQHDPARWTYSHYEDREDMKKDYDAGYENAKKQDKENSGCFLTTACVEYAGLQDDCHELAVLRSFRDCYVVEQLNGAKMVTEYYLVAPAIVHCIYQSTNRDAELARMFKVITEAVRLIDGGNNEEALALYQGLFKELKDRYSRVLARE